MNEPNEHALYQPLLASLGAAADAFAAALGEHGACPGCGFCDQARGVLYALRVHAAALGADGPAPGPRPARSLLTTTEAAEYLGVCEMTVVRLWHRRQLKKTKVGRLTRWRKAELDRYLDRQTRGPR